MASEITARDITPTYITLAVFVCHGNGLRRTRLYEVGRSWTKLDEADAVDEADVLDEMDVMNNTHAGWGKFLV